MSVRNYVLHLKISNILNAKPMTLLSVLQMELILMVAMELMQREIKSTNINTATCRFPVILILLSVVLTIFMKVISRAVMKNR